MKIKGLSNPVPFLMILTSFGPYVFMSLGLRTEQLFIYSLLPFSIMTLCLFRRSIVFSYSNIAILFLLLLVTLWTLIVTLFGPTQHKSIFDVLAGIENYIQPITIIFILNIFVKYQTQDEARNYFLKVINLIIILLLINCALSVFMLFFNIEDIMRFFWRGTTERFSSVGSRAASMQRLCGVFNQPMEAGLTYSLGIFLWVYRNRIKGTLSTFDLLALIGLMIGGILTVSKVFILGGLFVFLLYCINYKTMRSFLSWKVVSTFIVIIPVILILLSHWERGLYFFTNIFKFSVTNPAEIIEVLTSGRYGVAESNVQALSLRVISESPLYGFGFAAADTVDSSYVQFFYQGGLVALFAYIGILIIIGWPGFKNYLFFHTEERRFLFFLFIFIVGAGIGAPVITVNRFSTVFWVVYFLLLKIDSLARKVAKRGALVQGFDCYG
jgi:hypothetical protein